MKFSKAPPSHAGAALAILLSSFATAHPLSARLETPGCAIDGTQIAAAITCGQTSAVQACVLLHGSSAASLQPCLEQAGCAPSAAQSETEVVVRRCSSSSSSSSGSSAATEGNEDLELRRRVYARQTTTEASATASSTASTTSSSASSTSTSTSTANQGMTTISYIIAGILGGFAAVCVGGMCICCAAERSKLKKEKAAAEAKQALLARS